MHLNFEEFKINMLHYTSALHTAILDYLVRALQDQGVVLDLREQDDAQESLDIKSAGNRSGPVADTGGESECKDS